MDLKECFKNLQVECNKLYEKYGATDEVMQLQIAINTLRNKFDVVDETELSVDNEGFVQ